jgi:hypothetical protein
MATKKERYPSTLTLAREAAMAEGPIYGQIWPADSGNSPGSLPVRLSAGLPYQLPEPARTPRGRKNGPVARGLRRMPIEAFRAQPGPILREPGPFSGPPQAGLEPLHVERIRLGPPLTIRDVAALIGCSPWTVRQTLIPRGLPFFRFKTNGRLIFYRDQVIRWIEKQQGGPTTK